MKISEKLKELSEQANKLEDTKDGACFFLWYGTDCHEPGKSEWHIGVFGQEELFSFDISFENLELFASENLSLPQAIGDLLDKINERLVIESAITLDPKHLDKTIIINKKKFKLTPMED